MNVFEGLADFGKPIAYYPQIAHWLGSVNAGIFLCQLIYWQGKGRKKGWVYKTRGEWREETALTRTEQENARKTLKELGLVTEKLMGMPATVHYKLNLGEAQRLWEAWVKARDEQGEKEQLSLTEPSSWQETDQLVGGKGTNQSAGKEPTSRQETAKLNTRDYTETTSGKAVKPEDALADYYWTRLKEHLNGGTPAINYVRLRKIYRVLLSKGVSREQAEEMTREWFENPFGKKTGWALGPFENALIELQVATQGGGNGNGGLGFKELGLRGLRQDVREEGSAGLGGNDVV
jgi:hypothetical protein